ncbi:arylsulfatase [Pontiella agarivorans]|uniref:Arylsulfatase n=1 Tax=Pontiella agarivorans TaxID=3038953 RepID=A0ABU5N183_9BACT|nr:arylsulfatase [Pontiella agarivorans]MDZ8120011.1 arylsulfatase [Pontiella agarivorans]
MKKLWIWALSLSLSCTGMAARRPNVILIMTDDQGYGDIAAHGNPQIQTPEMDRLHSESVRLTDFHVDPTCAPTRGALMTGKYSHRARVWHTTHGGNHLRKTEVTMGDVFKHNGYDTAMFGKWHLGANYPYRPIDRGFDEWIGLGDGGPGTTDDWFWNDRVNDTYWHNGEREFREGYNPDVFFDAAIDYVKTRSSEKPFFVYLPTYAPHTPCTVPDQTMADKYKQIGVPADRAFFYAMIERVDQNIGRLRAVLADENLSENTLVIFMTDNGGKFGRKSFNAGMSGGKGSSADGGHRVPCFFCWPGGLLGEPRDIPTLSAHIDLLPTLVELCGMELPRSIDFDGTSLVPLLRGTSKKWPERTLFVEGQRSVEPHKGSRSAVMTQKWRLVGQKKLYAIQEDPGQAHDVSGQFPEVVKQLKDEFNQYWEHVTPDHRSYPAPIVGTPYDEEILLGCSEYREKCGFAHSAAAKADEVEGIWHIEAATAGRYEFEVYRWPRESGDGTMQGIPTVTKTVDAWELRPRTHLIYASEFKKLPVASVSLKVGDFNAMRSVSAADKSVVFEVNLPKGKTTVESIFYDESGKRLTHAYYVYVRKIAE